MFKKKAETAKEVKTSEAPAKEAVVKEPQTLEEANQRIKELQEKLTPKKPPAPTKEELEKKEKQMVYFKELSRGAKFIEFIINDLNRAGYNRAKRRRIISELMNKKFSQEFIVMYEQKVENIIKFLETELKITAGEDIKSGDKIEIINRKVFTVKPPVDAVEFLAKAKKEAHAEHGVKKQETQKPNEGTSKSSTGQNTTKGI